MRKTILRRKEFIGEIVKGDGAKDMRGAASCTDVLSSRNSILDYVNQKLNVPGIADFHQELRNLLRPR